MPDNPPNRLETVNSERWEQIARLYEQVLDEEPSARRAFIDRTCSDDPDMRRELETLLAADNEPGLIDRPVWSAASDLMEPAPALEPGSALGPYQIDRLVAEGGMGQVFRAVDTRLNRTVAVKILPPTDGIDPRLRERFGREAQAGASLAHPHVCTLYDVGSRDGVDFIVMEYLEGDTLAARLAKGPLPLDRALQCAIEVADALDHAHRSVIVHRDVKPANIMLARAGTKLMDFGVAKRRSSVTDAGGASLTQQGTIVGTIRYMSPEQVEGLEADHRSDIFSFGAVVYEMVTGRPAFDGGSAASIMAAILEREPPAMATLQQLTPPALDHIVGRCLAKQPNDRWQSAGDVMRELKWVAGANSVAAPTLSSAPAKFSEGDGIECRPEPLTSPGRHPHLALQSAEQPRVETAQEVTLRIPPLYTSELNAQAISATRRGIDTRPRLRRELVFDARDACVLVQGV